MSLLKLWILRITTHQQRIFVKGLVQKFQLLVWSLLGVKEILLSQQSEIDRLKSFVFFLEGRLNIALFGIPNHDEYKAFTLGSGVTDNRSWRLRELDAGLYRSRSLSGETVRSLGLSSSVKQVLLIGSDSQKEFQNILKLDEGLKIADWTPEFLPPGLESEKIYTVGSPSSVISILPKDSLDLVLIDRRFSHLAPLEQFQFLTECHRVLKVGGQALLWWVDFNQSPEDFWSDHRNLRPISIKALLSFSANQGIKAVPRIIFDTGTNVHLTALEIRK